MKPIFCTLFNKFYLSRGVALLNSLKRSCYAFHLYIFAFDKETEEALNSLNEPNCTIIGLVEFEDHELLKIKPTRTAAEYCWTCTPSTIKYVLDNFNENHCTYIDADMIFYRNPAEILKDFTTDRHIIITPHRYTERFDQSVESGIYCVQFVTFRNSSIGRDALTWWRNACLDWCYARVEDGKFGDQKYLDDWTTRFEGVWDLQHEGMGLAPWNIQQYNTFLVNDGPLIVREDNGEVYPVYFYHFHGFKFIDNQTIELCEYPIPKRAVKLFYISYFKQLLVAEKNIQNVGYVFDSHGVRVSRKGVKAIAYALKNRLKNQYQVYSHFEMMQ